MFFFVGGTQIITEQKYSHETQYCERCHNTKHWILERQRYWISLFFIPAVPYKTKYIAYCPVCHNTYVITKEMYDKG